MTVLVGELEVVTEAPPTTNDPARPDPPLPSASARDAELEHALRQQSERAARTHAD
jgi:hypothetical protein